MSPRETAWRAVQVSYAKRISGMVPSEAPATDFDVDSVVSLAPVPKSSALSEHIHCWDALRRRFDEAWA